MVGAPDPDIGMMAAHAETQTALQVPSGPSRPITA